MYTFENMLAVTNRSLCEVPFLEQIERLAARHPAGIILREKDLSEEAYEKLAGQVMEICGRYSTACILHTHSLCAKRLQCVNIHLPLWKLKKVADELEGFRKIGVSIHSISEALEAVELGATYLTAGHIFPTDCKKGVPARGLEFLREICQAVSVPVYGIGGITEKNSSLVLAQGAKGYCVMSQAMKYR